MSEIIHASSKSDLEIVKTLFIEYQHEVDIDYCFQSFDAELSTLPGKYSKPTGCLLLLKDNNKIVGCVAMRSIDMLKCEIKRLYIRPNYRGQHFGKQLTKEVIGIARELGYSTIMLETFSSLAPAIALYKELGFVVSGLSQNELELGLVKMSLNLRR